MGKTCQICGKNSGMYPLCREHLEMKAAGQVVKCEDCGTWHFVDEKCACLNCIVEPGSKARIKNEGRNNKASELTCLLCKEPSDGKHFCSKCWKKYFYTYEKSNNKIKKITVIIDDNLKCEVIDKYGNRDVKTANGMYVRSQQEKIIYDELYSRNIKIEYEPTIFYKNDKGETDDLSPDFYLTDYDLYIEHWGYEDTADKGYKKTKAFKEEIYKKQNKRVAGTSSADIKDIKAAIDRIFFENDIIIKK